ncbi:helix-turn-helix transcriptional regulator [Sphaerotilaceae bacterium SBD11-9]
MAGGLLMQPTQPGSSPTRVEGERPEFLRMRTVMRLTGLGRSTIYRLVAEHHFPSPVRLGLRAVGWRRADIDRWSDARPKATH